MSKELARDVGLEIGQKVLYPHQVGSNYGSPIYMSIVTIKDVRIIPPNQEVVVDVEELEGHVDYGNVYTQYQINNMFDYHDFVETEKDEKKNVTDEDKNRVIKK